jgi:Lectin C-type domain
MLSRVPRVHVRQHAQKALLVSAITALSTIACMSADDQANFTDMTGILQSGGSAGIDPGMAGTAGATTGGAASGGDSATGGSGGSGLGGSGGDTTTGGSAGSGLGGSSGDGGVTNGGGAGAGSGGTDQGGTANGGSGGSAVCEPNGVERCDGIDNNCENGIDDEECPENCTGVAHGSQGYMFCTDTFGLDSQNDVRAFCTDRDMLLVAIETSVENDFVVEAAVNAGLEGLVWIGANDMGTGNEGEWELSTGVQFWRGGLNGEPVGDLDPWDQGQPDNGDFGPDEDCAVLQLSNGLWRDENCDENVDRDFVCESAATNGLP